MKIETLTNDQSIKERFVIASTGFLLFFLFTLLSYFVAREHFANIDFDTTVRIQDNISRRLDAPFSTFSLLGSFELTTIIFLAIAAAGIIRKKRRLLVLVWFPLFHVIEIFAKTLIDQTGPPFMFLRYTFGFHFPTTYVSSDFYSYPSGHVGRTFFLGSMFAYFVYRSKIGKVRKILFYLLVAGICGAMAVSRVYLGEHWISDTIGGALLGLSFAMFALSVW